MGQPPHKPKLPMVRVKRDPLKRRIPISACVTNPTAEDLEDAACHHNISMSEIVSRILSKACHERFPTDREEFNKMYPLHYDP